MSEAFDYSRAEATAQRLIAKFGQAGVIQRLAAGAGPAYAPGDPIPADHPCTVVVTAYSLMERANSLILANDRKALISTAGLAISPQPGDRLVVGGMSLQIINVKTLNPGGTVVLYQAQARL